MKARMVKLLGWLARLILLPLVAAALALPANAGFVSNNLAATELLGAAVFGETSALSAPIGRIENLVIDRNENVAAGLIRSNDGRTSVLSFEHFRIFQNGPDLFVVVDPGVLAEAGRPFTEDLGTLLTKFEAPAGVGYRRQELLFSYYGSNPLTDIADLLADIATTFGNRAFWTRPYEVQKGDTACSIYAAMTALPLTRRNCPPAAERLFQVTNDQLKGPMPGLTAAIPVLDIVPRKGDPSYTIALPVDARMAEQFFGSFALRNSRDFSVDYTNAGVGLQKQYQAAWDRVPQPPDLLCSQAATPPKEKAFYYLFDWLADADWQPSDEVKACMLDCRALNPNDDSACSDIVLVDQVLQPHSDIAGVIPMDKEGNILPPLQSQTAQSCTIDEPFDGGSQHGTHLASIIASKADGQGFVGISPGLDLYAYPWNTASSTSDLGELFLHRTNTDVEKGPIFSDMGPQVFVFASRFLPADGVGLPYSYNKSDVIGNRLKPGVNPLSYKAQREIQNSSESAIWVVSAMQIDKDTPEALEIVPDLAFSPANLGDLKNVIVVTACDKCSEGNASVWKDAFFSDRRVHVAAPGIDVLAPVGAGHFAVAGGTSQATAIVGGVVGAMINCYPKHYRGKSVERELLSGVVKERLQYTSKPVFYELDDLKRLAAGVVDPRAALLDPGKTWIKYKGKRDYTELSGDDELIHWCQDRVVLVDKQGDALEKPPSTKNLLRMVRTKVPGGILGNDNPWVLYSLRPIEPRGIDRFEPRVFEAPDMEDQPIAKKKSGEFLHPSEFDDLILSATMLPKQC